MELWINDAQDVPPEGVIELLAAEAWGIPPWQVAEGPTIWIERFRLLQNARANKAAYEQRKHG